MKLSTKERRYRYKIIAENHLKKYAQKYLDKYVKRKSLTYEMLYLCYGFLHSMLAQYNLSKLSNAMKGFGESCAKAASSFKVLTASLKPLGDYEKCKQLKR